jgi:hypothetical protein
MIYVLFVILSGRWQNQRFPDSQFLSQHYGIAAFDRPALLIAARIVAGGRFSSAPAMGIESTGSKDARVRESRQTAAAC